MAELLNSCQLLKWHHTAVGVECGGEWLNERPSWSTWRCWKAIGGCSSCSISTQLRCCFDDRSSCTCKCVCSVVPTLHFILASLCGECAGPNWSMRVFWSFWIACLMSFVPFRTMFVCSENSRRWSIKKDAPTLQNNRNQNLMWRCFIDPEAVMLQYY